ncbi:CoA pyrophosphatase [Haematospirillum sp. H1815]|uniref:CoA pyrophosphatase n=1 Tax=Haematospirillum sp. H1815 TaxID=2723108 RepID=UPI0014391C63|nr:CoA pyrophosphatase [Haematospirillum sp. H1815]NKD76864.1 CoA pyrophosphatase [Haematospirillum sp. H1815]
MIFSRDRLATMLEKGYGTGLSSDEDADPLSGGDTLCPAAVLVPLVCHPSACTILLTRRTDHLDHHAGQIAFPGGRLEARDKDAVDCALRETAEETGLDRRGVDVVGRLDDYRTVTGFRVTPVVGLLSPPLGLDPDPGEVAEVFEVPLDFVLDPRNHRQNQIVVNGQSRLFYSLSWNDYYIWGATAGMLVNLSRVLNGGAVDPGSGKGDSV